MSIRSAFCLSQFRIDISFQCGHDLSLSFKLHIVALRSSISVVDLKGTGIILLVQNF